MLGFVDFINRCYPKSYPYLGSRFRPLRRCNVQHYTRHVIKTFAHKGLERFFKHGSKRAISASHAPRIRRILDRLDAVLVPEAMNRGSTV